MKVKEGEEARKDRERAKRWREANPGKNRANSAAWRKVNPEKQRAATNAWRKANPEKYRVYLRDMKKKRSLDKKKAYTAIHNGISRGKIIKPISCQICGKETRVEAHHYDYKKPLDVIWVCRKHHIEIHRSAPS